MDCHHPASPVQPNIFAGNVIFAREYYSSSLMCNTFDRCSEATVSFLAFDLLTVIPRLIFIFYSIFPKYSCGLVIPCSCVVQLW